MSKHNFQFGNPLLPNYSTYNYSMIFRLKIATFQKYPVYENSISICSHLEKKKARLF